MGEPRPLEWIVRDALPGDDDASRTRRLAVIRVVHAAQSADQRLSHLGAAVRCYLESPDDLDASGYAWGAWISAEQVANSLEALAVEIRKSRRKLVELAGLDPD